ncbi:MAG: APC family permease [Mycoplasmoidaceae bacterium]
MSQEELKKDISHTPKKNKISFFSATTIVAGSTIGAGIFLKSESVLTGSWHSLVLAILVWLVSGISIICMALSLIEIAGASPKNNLSFIGWCRVFNKPIIYKAAKNFMVFIYIPINYFFIPFYILMQLSQGIGAFIGDHSSPFSIGTKYDSLIWSFIGLLIAIYFVIVSGRSSKIGNIQNYVITSAKILPILVAMTIGFIWIAIEHNKPGYIPPHIIPDVKPGPKKGPMSLDAFSPFFGFVLAMAAVFYAYDGFYVTAGLQTEMKEPKKTPIALFLGLVIVTVIYLTIAISMSLNGSGSFSDYGKWLNSKHLSWLFGLVNILISFGICGVLNSYSMWTPRLIENLIELDEIPFSHKLKSKLNNNYPKIGIRYFLSIFVPVYFILVFIGIYGYKDPSSNYPAFGSHDLHLSTGLIPFADLMANWITLWAFFFIVLSIIGCLINRKTNKIVTEQKKYFIPTAWVAVITISFVLAIQILVTIVNVFLLGTSQGGVKASPDDIKSRVLLLLILILFGSTAFLPTIIHTSIKKYNKKRKLKIQP